MSKLKQQEYRGQMTDEMGPQYAKDSSRGAEAEDQPSDLQENVMRAKAADSENRSQP